MKKMIAKHPASWAITALTILSAIGALSYFGADIQVPTHWNAQGEVDGTSSAVVGFSIMPTIQIFTLLLLSNLHLLEPRKEHLEKSEGFLHIVALGCTVLFAAIQGQIIAVTLGYESNISVTFLCIGALFAIIGNYLGKLQSTFTVGIRTPWTLSSETVWRKTHRLGGKLMLMAGLIIIGASLFAAPELQVQIMLATILPATLLPVFYSWALWRKEQQQ